MANFDLVIKLPKPKTKPAPTINKAGFPPALPSLKPPQLAGLKRFQAMVEKYTSIIKKVIGVIQNAPAQAKKIAAEQTITLKVKRGDSVVFEKKVAPATYAPPI
jgi:hypothetical protein